MNYKSMLLTVSSAFVFIACASPALAHNILCACYANNDQTITCEGGFSDGGSAKGLKVKVISYKEDVLVDTKLDDSSTVTFKQPEGEFYILIDGGPGHSAEIDYADIDGITKK